MCVEGLGVEGGVITGACVETMRCWLNSRIHESANKFMGFSTVCTCTNFLNLVCCWLWSLILVTLASTTLQTTVNSSSANLVTDNRMCAALTALRPVTKAGASDCVVLERILRSYSSMMPGHVHAPRPNHSFSTSMACKASESALGVMVCRWSRGRSKWMEQEYKSVAPLALICCATWVGLGHHSRVSSCVDPEQACMCA